MGMIPHNIPTLGVEEKCAAKRVIASGWVAQGREVEAFENELCRFLKIPEGHALAVSSGSAALYLALWVLRGNNKRIGLPVYTCSSLRNAVHLVNGQVVYLDCAKGSPNLDVSAANSANIDILIAASMFGIPVELPAKRSFKVIEDISQSLGATISGKKIGLRGEIGVCSFYATKMMTSGGQGGAVFSYDKTFIDILKDYREFDSRHDEMARFNFQMTDLQAAIGRVQLRKMPLFVKKRERIFDCYRSSGLSMLDSISPASHSVRYRAVMRSDDPSEVIRSLKADGVRAIVPIEKQELSENLSLYPMALNLAGTTVSLPCYPNLSEKEAMSIARTLKKHL
jgi:perosamine synthetase